MREREVMSARDACCLQQGWRTFCLNRPPVAIAVMNERGNERRRDRFRGTRNRLDEAKWNVRMKSCYCRTFSVRCGWSERKD